MVENLEGRICVYDVGRQRSDERSHFLSGKLEINSVGQLQAETMGRPGLLALWILSHIYFLSKIHKANTSGDRPVVGQVTVKS